MIMNDWRPCPKFNFKYMDAKLKKGFEMIISKELLGAVLSIEDYEIYNVKLDGGVLYYSYDEPRKLSTFYKYTIPHDESINKHTLKHSCVMWALYKGYEIIESSVSVKIYRNNQLAYIVTPTQQYTLTPFLINRFFEACEWVLSAIKKDSK